MDALYDLVGPLALIGVVAGCVVMFGVPTVFPRFRRPYLAAWIVGSSFLAPAVFIDRLANDEPISVAFACAVGVLGGFATIVVLVRLRVHMWDGLVTLKERQARESREARYRGKDFTD